MLNIFYKFSYFLLFITFFNVNLFSNPIRVLFLGHDSDHHNSNEYYPILSKSFGVDAIYFDYTTSLETALGDFNHLNRFDALLIYGNHEKIEPHQWKNLNSFVKKGGGFLPIHSASWCFANEPRYDKLVGGRFESHLDGVFSPRIIDFNHEITKDLEPYNEWDETYFHINHNKKNRKVLMVRDVMPGDPNKDPEPWTWIRTHGKGRVFYTASGHDERVWSSKNFQNLIKNGILWSVGDNVKKKYNQFLLNRENLSYEERENIPNYEKREKPLSYQLPLSPEESMKYTQAPIDFELTVFASEPQIINPVYMQWDEKGRLWVAESIDYPNDISKDRKGNDRIKILEDTNGDGKADKSTIFVEGLNILTSFTFGNDGVIVAHAPDLLFFKDKNGDDVADHKEVLLSGFGIYDTHAGPSNLRYGFDNWIYGTVGYSGFNAIINDNEHDFSMGIFRFKPDGSKIEFLYQFNNNTWGLGFTESGDVFGSTANGNPSFFGGIPSNVYEEFYDSLKIKLDEIQKQIDLGEITEEDGRGQMFWLGAELKNSIGMSAKMIANSATFYPITPNIRQVDWFGSYTSAAGHSFATSSGFPKSWRNSRAFVCGPTGHLLGMYDIKQKGSGFEAINKFSFVASADEWFSPVAAEVGPDGNLWIADWYNFIIQHNPTPDLDFGGYDGENGIGNAHINPNRDKMHGRIYKVNYVKNNYEKSNYNDLKNNDELLDALNDDNLFWRLTAQRLIVEKNNLSIANELKNFVLSERKNVSIHALWALKGLDQLDKKTHINALKSKNNELVKNAIKALSKDYEHQELFFESNVLFNENPQIRLIALTQLLTYEKNKEIIDLIKKIKNDDRNKDDEWIKIALNTLEKLKN